MAGCSYEDCRHLKSLIARDEGSGQGALEHGGRPRSLLLAI